MSLAMERAAVIKGDDTDEGGGACEEYTPGRHDTVFDAGRGTFKGVRRCKHCECLEDDHEEPADSARITIVPPPAVDGQSVVSAAGLRSDQEHARDLVEHLLGGPPDTWFPRLVEQVTSHLKRPPNRWELAALRCYVCGVAVDLLAAQVGPASGSSP